MGKAMVMATSSEPNLLQNVLREVTTEIRNEIDLAKNELLEKVKSAGIGAGMISASALTGLLTLGCLTALIAVSLSLVIPAWAAVLAVTILWAAVTASLALFGKKKVEDAAPFVPEQAIENVKKDVARVRRRAANARSKSQR